MILKKPRKSVCDRVLGVWEKLTNFIFSIGTSRGTFVNLRICLILYFETKLLVLLRNLMVDTGRYYK